MENVNEIITSNDEIVEAVEGVERSRMKFIGGFAVGVGITAIMGYAAYRFVVKPAIMRYKAKKTASPNEDSVNYDGSEIVVDVEKESA